MSTPTTEPARTARATPDTRWAALTVVAVAQLMVALDATIVNIALPSAQADLGFGDDARQWGGTGYTCALAGLLLLGGRIADPIGRRRAFLGGLAGFSLASALAGAAPSFGRRVPGPGPRGGGSLLRLARRRSSRAGGVRRGADPDRTVADRGHVHEAAGAGPGLRRLRGRGLQRRRDGAVARWRAHRVRRLALVPVRERRHRRAGFPGRPGGAPGPGRLSGDACGRPLRPARHRGPRRRRPGLLPGGRARVDLAAGSRPRRDRGSRGRGVPVAADPLIPALAAGVAAPRPVRRRRLPGGRGRRRRRLRHVPDVDLPLPGRPRLEPGAGRLGFSPAVGRGGGQRLRPRQPAAAPGPPPPP